MVKVRKKNKRYDGTERSPYYEWLENRGDIKQEHEAKELAEANPDMLAEEKGFYFSSNVDVIESEQYEKYLSILPSLTRKQRDILNIVGKEGRSFEECANRLGISKGAVQKTIERIRRKIK